MPTLRQTYFSEYRTWNNIKQRCYNKNSPWYKEYGGKDITMCARWRNSFEDFFEDMGARPTGLQLDRKNNNGNYTPKNCHWVTCKVNNNNKRRYKNSGIWIIQGVKYSIVRHAAEALGFSEKAIRTGCRGYTSLAGKFYLPKPGWSYVPPKV